MASSGDRKYFINTFHIHFSHNYGKAKTKLAQQPPTLDTTWKHLKATFRVHQCKYLIIYNIVHYHISLAN